MKTRSLILTTALFLAPALAAQQTPEPRKTVWDGVYTDAQADRGREHYMANCSPCHGVDLEGLNGVRLNGPDFMERWREFNITGLYDFISKSMPRQRPNSPNKPGSLSESTYTDIISLIL